MAYAPALTLFLDPVRVKVVFEDLAPTTETVTIYRTGEETVAVPGTIGMFAAGGVTVDDWWAPYGGLTYYADMFNAAGVKIGTTSTASLTLWGEAGTVTLMDPYNPASQVVVSAESQFAESLTRSRDVERYNIGGRVVALMGDLGLYEGVNLRCYSENEEQRVAAWNVLKETLVLIRTTAPIPLPRLFYAVVGAPREVPFDHRHGGWVSVWDIAGDQVSPVTAGAAVASITWQDLIDRFATWDEVVEAYPTWLDLLEHLGD